MSLFWLLLFCCSAALFLYGYFLFPKILLTAAAMHGKKIKRNHSYRPQVSILIPAYNEQNVIREKLRNCLALEYPANLLDIMVCSDCSSDSTNTIVEEMSAQYPNIRLLAYSERSGKTGVLNRSIPQAHGEITVLTDANTMLQTDAVAKLVSAYADDSIAAVCCQVQLLPPMSSNGLTKEISYRNFESRIKYAEGLYGAVMGAFGGFYSIRTKLYEPLIANAYSNDDFLTVTNLLLRGYRVIFDPEALSIEDTASSMDEEFKRRIRIGTGNFQSFFLSLRLLNPLCQPQSIFYFSHKVLRWFSPFLLLLIFLSNLFLLSIPFFVFIMVLQIFFYAAGTAGYILSRRQKSIPLFHPFYHFISMNYAILLGFFRYLKGVKSATWQSTKRSTP